MSKKPPRPPAPKLGGGGGGGLSFSFKALEEEDDEELTVFTGKFDKQVSEEREKQALGRERERERSTSKTPERSRTNSDRDSVGLKVEINIEQAKGDKEKIQDGGIKRSNGVDEQENETANGDGLKSEVIDANSDVAPVKNESVGSELNELNSEFFDADGDSRTETEFKSMDNDDGVNNIEMVDEYYNPEYSEDFADLPGVVPTIRQRSRFHKFRKVKPIVPVAPISMSKLSQNVSEEPTANVNNAIDENKNADSQSKNQEKPSNLILSLDRTIIPTRKLLFCGIFILLYMVIPLPSYINGMIVGVILSSGCWMLYLWVTQPPKPREPIPADPPLDKLPPMPVPEMKEPREDDCSYKVKLPCFISGKCGYDCRKVYYVVCDQCSPGRLIRG